MRLPIIPIVIAATLLSAVWYLFNATGSNRHRTLDVPRVSRLVDIEGIETEVAIAPDGNRLAVISSGDLWSLNLATGVKKRLTATDPAESFPNWTSDGKHITFTRGADTLSTDPDTGAEQPFAANANWLSWSTTGRTAFVRDRALWVANAIGTNAKKLVEADAVSDLEIRTPRFSPDALQIAFTKSQLGLRGEIWIVDVTNGMARPLVVDRPAENPLDVAWINEGRALAYLTNRAGAYSIWYVDLEQSTINPLTQPLDSLPLDRIGLSVFKDRLVLPRHFVDSNITVSDGSVVANSNKLEFQPAVSRDEKLVAYTVVDENKSEIWTAGVGGDQPTFRAVGREPRFSANGFELVFTHTDLNGNDDIWKLDIRNGSEERVTDAEEIDVMADWSSDGQSIAFASARGGAMSIWTIPASGGKRLRINEGGFAPRYSPDAKSILFWNRQSLWTMDTQGKNISEVATGIPVPSAGVWSKSKQEPKIFAKPMVDQRVWPGFDVLRDGRFVIAPIDIHETALWAIDLTYKENR